MATPDRNVLCLELEANEWDGHIRQADLSFAVRCEASEFDAVGRQDAAQYVCEQMAQLVATPSLMQAAASS